MMFEELVQNRISSAEHTDICKWRDVALAVEMAALLEVRLSPIRSLSDFKCTATETGVKVEFDRPSARGTRLKATLLIEHSSAERAMLRLTVNHGQLVSGYPAKAKTFVTANQNPADILDEILDERRADWTALLENWK